MRWVIALGAPLAPSAMQALSAFGNNSSHNRRKEVCFSTLCVECKGGEVLSVPPALAGGSERDCHQLLTHPLPQVVLTKDLAAVCQSEPEEPETAG